ncbi:MAG: hypothetical protein QOH79_3093 [Acidimicrobiaceae bacterium]
MSLNAMVDLAVARERGVPKRQGRFRTESDPAADADPEADASPVSKVGSVLVAAIPAEALALYTAFVTATKSRFVPSAEVAPTLKTAQLSDLASLRWFVFGAVLVGMIGYIFSGWRGSPAARRRKVPFAETLSAVVAFVAWAMAMPDGMVGLFVKSTDVEVVSLGVATAAAALLLGVSAPLRKQAKA